MRAGAFWLWWHSVGEEGRPISPYYSDMSLVMAEYLNEALKGSTPVDQALEDMQGELQNVVDQT